MKHTKGRNYIESNLIAAIARRATDELPYERIQVVMDVEAVHAVTPLDLDRLLNAGLADFMHDIVGIRRHLDRTTGKLLHQFSPRFAKRRA